VTGVTPFFSVLQCTFSFLFVLSCAVYGLSRVRPLALRLAMTLRPSAVDILQEAKAGAATDEQAAAAAAAAAMFFLVLGEPQDSTHQALVVHTVADALGCQHAGEARCTLPAF
jgi:hypothetical protein